ncbi:glycosyltransferase [Erythrobacter insulae]|uniref:Glycosyltransferase n=1 Tax=Erythrobacter insulae TaxID=2584124 RepID=A0A547PBA2_9SPHN|nr:glycosyltransferase [Erythrobacter insulae]TRD11413.1 glycosyltransferase [Erythrobacter insulae]
MMQLAPILVFGYNRPDKLDQVLKSLQRCPEFASSSVTIFVDGSKGSADIAKVEQVREVARSFQGPNVTHRIRDKNIGLKNSIREGVSKTFESHETAIIIEDDLVVAPGTLTYFNAALQKYADDDRVWSVSAYMYEVASCRENREAFFLPFANPWGWATWKRCWHAPEVEDQERAALLESRSFQTFFDGISTRDFASILALDERALVNSWFIHWYLKIFKAGGLTLWPPRSMIMNSGAADGTHASPLNFHRFLKKSPLSPDFVPQLPDDVCVDYKALDAIRGSPDARIQRTISKLGGYRRRLKAALR